MKVVIGKLARCATTEVDGAQVWFEGQQLHLAADSIHIPLPKREQGGGIKPTIDAPRGTERNVNIEA